MGKKEGRRGFFPAPGQPVDEDRFLERQVKIKSDNRMLVGNEKITKKKHLKARGGILKKEGKKKK